MVDREVVAIGLGSTLVLSCSVAVSVLHLLSSFQGSLDDILEQAKLAPAQISFGPNLFKLKDRKLKKMLKLPHLYTVQSFCHVLELCTF